MLSMNSLRLLDPTYEGLSVYLMVIIIDIFIHHRGGRKKRKKTVITITTIWKKEVT